MAGIYWLASYPKSGNTWMRILLTNYWRNSDEPADINHLDGGSIASARTLFDQWIGLDSADMTPAEIEAHKPLLYQHMAKKAEADQFIKVHDAYQYTSSGAPIFPPGATAGVIYLIRNPLDVTVSFAHHNQKTVEKTVEHIGCRTMTLAQGGKRLIQQFEQALYSWSDHVCSWVDAPDMRIQVVRYEDMVMQPFETFSQVVQFCGLPYDAARVEKALDFSTFERLQTQEAENGFGEKTPRAKSFFRKGKIGSWRDQLTDKQVHHLIEDHRDIMRRFGYLTDIDEIIF